MAAKKVTNKGISATVRKRLKKLPGSARSYLDPKTGKTYSRRQYEKNRNDRQPRKNKQIIDRKYRQYQQLLDSYIGKQLQKGKKLTKKQARESDEMKQLIKDLHSKDPQRKKRALEKTLRGDKVQDWTPYIKRWASGDL